MEEMIQKHDKDEKNRLKEYHKNYQAAKKKKKKKKKIRAPYKNEWKHFKF